jgi:FkbM family methyltransferase
MPVSSSRIHEYPGRNPDTMKFFKLTHATYVLLRKVAIATGLSKLLRSRLGPLAGRTVSRIAVNANQPSLVRGHRMMLSINSGYAPVAMVMDRYEEETTRLFESLVKPGMLVIDVGAHVGYYSLLAARGVGTTGKVYSFEPEPDNYGLLQANIQRNVYTNIESLSKAVSDRVGSVTLFLTALDTGRHSYYAHGLPERGKLEVESTTIDAFLDAARWPKVGLVKVDVEGAENDVLEGMGQLLRRSQDLKLIIEFSPTLLQNAGTPPPQFLQQLSHRGFQVHCIGKEGPVELLERDRTSLVDKLLRTESSLNLYCVQQ